MFLKWLLISGSLYVLIVTYYELFKYESSVLEQRLSRVQTLNSGSGEEFEILDLPFHERFIQPIIDKLVKSIATLIPISENSQTELRTRLLQAGVTTSPQDYRATNILIMLSLGIIASIFVADNTASIGSRLLYFVLGVFCGYVLRRYSLESKITARKKVIASQLPEVMDILSVSVAAGLSFYQALEHVVQRAEGPLIEEFKLAQREIALGRPRSVSLQNLADRTDVSDVKAFISAINQADELGISLKSVLSTQAKMIRESHRQSVEEHAAKIPVKILIPMVMFIFPVIFIVLLGPAVPQVMQALKGR